ncbi:hypothetical protein D3C81_808740 [compost metagenome]
MAAQYEGLSGFLAPDGIYYACDYLGHVDLAKRLVEKYKMELFLSQLDSNEVPNFIKFGCKPWTTKEGIPGDDHAFCSDAPTPVQVSWVLANLGAMTAVQREDIRKAFKRFDVDLGGGEQ